MPFSYHPPTRSTCEVCDALNQQDEARPIIDTHRGKASSANQYPFHNWYNFVLGYSPAFPDYMIQREGISDQHLVADPFMGSGTTLVTCKHRGIPSVGVDANDFMVDAARVKLRWDVPVAELKAQVSGLIAKIDEEMQTYHWDDNEHDSRQLALIPIQSQRDYQELLAAKRPDMLKERYISDKPLARAYLIDQVIQTQIAPGPIRNVCDLALTSIIVSISNVSYGPGFGVVKAKQDVDVLGAFINKIKRMVADMEHASDACREVPADVMLGDARTLCDQLAPNTVDIMVTSPPYPGDHEYTKHTRLELIFRGYAQNLDEFRLIKKRMLRASTTNIYKEDNDRASIIDLASLQDVTRRIQERLDQDGATSGFEKLYTKLVWEYFGGMSKALEQCFQVLKPGGKIALLVSDSHAFKMVHIQTAHILREIGERIGYHQAEIVLWQLKPSTSHKYFLRENILILQKPHVTPLR